MKSFHVARMLVVAKQFLLLLHCCPL